MQRIMGFTSESTLRPHLPATSDGDSGAALVRAARAILRGRAAAGQHDADLLALGENCCPAKGRAPQTTTDAIAARRRGSMPLEASIQPASALPARQISIV